MADLSDCGPPMDPNAKKKGKAPTLAFREGKGLRLLGETRAMGDEGPRGLQVMMGPEKAFIYVFAYRLDEDPRPILPRRIVLRSPSAFVN